MVIYTGVSTPVGSTLTRSSRPDPITGLSFVLMFSVDIVVDGQPPCWTFRGQPHLLTTALIADLIVSFQHPLGSHRR